jgi:hypothetical protein
MLTVIVKAHFFSKWFCITESFILVTRLPAVCHKTNTGTVQMPAYTSLHNIRFIALRYSALLTIAKL